MRITRRFVQSLLFGAALATGAAMAHPVGSGATGDPLQSTIPCRGTVCNVGTSSDPIPIAADPDAPNWIKQFVLEPVLVVGDFLTVQINEWLRVGQKDDPGLPWTDWHEVITGPAGWVWKEGSLTAGQTSYLGEVTSNGAEIDFFGFILAAGTDVLIQKILVCELRQPCGQSPTFTVREWPTVPEPATALLLFAGLAGMGMARRRLRT